jgi:hypothetical protein
MAELVDALASGASGLTAVEVRVLFWAPFFETASHESAAPFLLSGFAVRAREVTGGWR